MNERPTATATRLEDTVHATLRQAFAACARLQAFAFPGEQGMWLPRAVPGVGWQPEATPLPPSALPPQTNPLADTTRQARAVLAAAPGPAVIAAPNVRASHARCGPAIGFHGRPLPRPRGRLTGLDTGACGGSGFPSLPTSTNPIRG